MKEQMQKFRTLTHDVMALRRNGYSGPFFVGAAMWACGAWLLAPWITFSTSPVYRLMSEIAIEEFWGALMLAASSVMILSSLRRRPREVALSCLMSAFMWFLMLSSFAAGRVESLLVPISFVMMVRCMSLHREFLVSFDSVTGMPYARERQVARPPQPGDDPFEEFRHRHPDASRG